MLLLLIRIKQVFYSYRNCRYKTVDDDDDNEEECVVNEEENLLWNWLQDDNMTEDELIAQCCRHSARATGDGVDDEAAALYDKEESRDVIFLVGTEPDVWRIPGHKSVLGKNPVFRAMLEGPLAEKHTTMATSSATTTIVVEDVDGKAFDLLLGFLYNSRVELSSVGTALATLYAANKYLCTELVAICIQYLDQNITVQSVLQIYQHSRIYSLIPNFPDDDTRLFGEKNDNNNNNNNNNNDESVRECSSTMTMIFEDIDYREERVDQQDPGKPDHNNSDDRKFAVTLTGYCTRLLFNCYHFIDENADQVLGQEYVEDLTRDALYDIARRSTLAVSSELLVFSAINRWCNRECKRRRLELTKENRLRVLGDKLLFAVRYLLMDYDEYVDGPLRSGLFDKHQNSVLLGHILNQALLEDTDATIKALSANLTLPQDNVTTVEQAAAKLTPDVLQRLREQRNPNNAAMPVPLSRRSREYCSKSDASRNSNANAPLQKKGAQKKESKKDARKKLKEKRDSRCLDYTLSVLACIFD